MKNTIKLSRDTFEFLMELAGYEADNRDFDEDEQELWEEALKAREEQNNGRRFEASNRQSERLKKSL